MAMNRAALKVYFMLTAVCWCWLASFGVDATAWTTLKLLLQMKPYALFAPYILITITSTKIGGVNRAMMAILGLPLTFLLLSLLPMNNTVTLHVVPTYTPKQCEWILNQTLGHVKEHGWSPYRQRFYPKSELSTHLIPKVHGNLTGKVFPKTLGPLLEQQFRGTARVSGLFVVEYTPETQAGVPPHIDMGQASWITLLSSPEEFEGGGTRFVHADRTIHLEQGQSVVFPAKLLHEGLPVTAGARYILAGFADIDTSLPFSLLYLWGAYGYGVNVEEGPFQKKDNRADGAEVKVQLGVVVLLFAGILKGLDYYLDTPQVVQPPKKAKAN